MQRQTPPPGSARQATTHQNIGRPTINRVAQLVPQRLPTVLPPRVRDSRIVLQMTPDQWRQSEQAKKILDLPKGNALTSKWPPVQRLVAEYGHLGSSASPVRREQLLNQLEDAIKTWRLNQQSATVVNKVLVTQKHDALSALEKVIQQERAELNPVSSAPPVSRQPPPPPFVPPSSVPRAMGGFNREMATTSSGSRQVPQPLVPHSPVSPRESPLVDARWKNASFADELWDEFDNKIFLSIHATKDEYVDSIHHGGLIPGKESGIGLANDENLHQKIPDKTNLYVLSGSFNQKRQAQNKNETQQEFRLNSQTISLVTSEAGSSLVIVVSLTPGTRDVNYRRGAQLYPHAAPSIRKYAPSSGTTYSFTLPMTSLTKQQLTAFVNTVMTHQLNQDEAIGLVKRQLHRKCPLQTLKLI
jgi:hypothetical protein